MNKVLVVAGVTASASLLAGAAGGYFFARRSLEMKYAQLARQEIEEARTFFKRLNKTDEFETPEKAVKELIGESDGNEFVAPQVSAAAVALETYKGVVPADRVNYSGNLETRNVFAKTPLGDEDWAKELRDRTEEAPYVLNQDEYMANESGYTQVTFTYYAGDGVLADDRDDLISDVDDMVGLYNLKKFGHWSGDPRVVYVKCDIRELEFEIKLHDGKYSEVVAGLQDG